MPPKPERLRFLPVTGLPNHPGRHRPPQNRRNTCIPPRRLQSLCRRLSPHTIYKQSAGRYIANRRFRTVSKSIIKLYRLFCNSKITLFADNVKNSAADAKMQKAKRFLHLGTFNIRFWPARAGKTGLQPALYICLCADYYLST